MAAPGRGAPGAADPARSVKTPSYEELTVMIVMAIASLVAVTLVRIFW
jgi:hypothetical protein